MAYPTLLLLQIKILSGDQHRGLAIGDESGHHNRLRFKDFTVDIAWSLLYTAFIEPDAPTTDPFAVTTLHRVLVICSPWSCADATSARPDHLAGARWWVVLPITDTASTVYLFAVILAVAHAADPGVPVREARCRLCSGHGEAVRNDTSSRPSRWRSLRLVGKVDERTRRSRTVRSQRCCLLPLAVAVILGFDWRMICPLRFLDGTTHAPWKLIPPTAVGPKHTYKVSVYAFGISNVILNEPNPMLYCPGHGADLVETPSLAETRRNPSRAAPLWWNVTAAGPALLNERGQCQSDYFPPAWSGRAVASAS